MDSASFLIIIISLLILILLHLSGAAIIIFTMRKDSPRIQDTLAVASIFIVIFLLDLILIFVIQHLDQAILSEFFGITASELDSSIQAFIRRNSTF